MRQTAPSGPWEKGDSPHLPERAATNLRSVPGFAQMGTVPFFREELARLNPGDPEYAARSVDAVLAAARNLGASDVHFQPTAGGLELKCRVDGVLIPVTVFPAAVAVILSPD